MSGHFIKLDKLLKTFLAFCFSRKKDISFKFWPHSMMLWNRHLYVFCSLFPKGFCLGCIQGATIVDLSVIIVPAPEYQVPQAASAPPAVDFMPRFLAHFHD